MKETIKNVRNFDVAGKKVLVRCNFDVPLSESGVILDNFRIMQNVSTILHLIKKEAKIILISHLGRPTDGGKNQKYSLKPVASELEKLLNRKVKFLSDCIGENTEKEIREMKAGQVILLENLRFYPEEKNNDKDFAKKLAGFGEIYINDAFSVCHRSHASIEGIPKYLLSGAGLSLADEIKVLSMMVENPEKPLVIILGGAKVETKIKVIEKFFSKADHLLIGGKIGNALLQAQGVVKEKNLYGGKVSREVIEKIKKIDLTNSALHLPLDVIVCLGSLEEGYIRDVKVAEIQDKEKIFDLGSITIKDFSETINQARTVFWNGPVGRIEEERFEKGTLAVADAILKSKAFSIVGGGDTIAFLEKYNLREKFNYVSGGGGAMLSYLSGKLLPGIEALK